MSEPSSCRSCNMPILWARKDSGKFNRPLNAESAQAGFCIVDGVVRYTLMYTAHVCSAEDIQAYERRRDVGFSVKREEALEAQAAAPVNLDAQPVPTRNTISESVAPFVPPENVQSKTSQSGEVLTFDASGLPWSKINPLTVQFHGAIEENYYAGVYKVGCRKCGAPEGQPCMNLNSFRNYASGKFDNPSIMRCRNPHPARTEDAGRLGFFSYQNGTH